MPRVGGETWLTLSLEAMDQGNLAGAGGKGASLGAMVQAGLPVPEGFAVLTKAYGSFVRHNGLEEGVRQLVQDVAPDNPQALEGAAQALKDRFIAGEIPAPRGRPQAVPTHRRDRMSPRDPVCGARTPPCADPSGTGDRPCPTW